MPQPTVENISGFHLEPTNICTLKCAGCARTRFIQQWPEHWKNHSIDLDALFKFLDIDLTNKKITLCGNYGDPIYHPDLSGLIKEFKQRGAHISITTNGSYRKVEWWQELCALLDEQDQVCFSIDGLPENFTQYRVNADWESIKTGIDTCVDSRCRTTWKFIVFSYNQSNIEQARQLSSSLGIDLFKVMYSDRFDSETEYLKPAASMLGNRYQAQVEFKNNKKNFEIDARCSNHNEHYISAEGFYAPCCYAGDHRFYYKTQFGKDKKNYNIKNYTLSQLLAAPDTIQFYNNLKNHSVCQYNCPANI
jgi:wyosine [tRNA(Phe)-imidazoG37] synthetase (radical SAM superfamily)